jgi:hypothetical protein
MRQGRKIKQRIGMDARAGIQESGGGKVKESGGGGGGTLGKAAL